MSSETRKTAQERLLKALQGNDHVNSQAGAGLQELAEVEFSSIFILSSNKSESASKCQSNHGFIAAPFLHCLLHTVFTHLLMRSSAV